MKIFCGLCTAVLLAGVLTAQTPGTDSASMQALLNEVRQLRHTVEKTLSLGPRMQILLQRAQFQQQKVAHAQTQLDEVRKQITDQTARQNAANERLARIEQDINAESDAGKRAQLEDMRSGLKMVAGNGPDQQLRARESELNNALETEQAMLNEYNDKLDALERQMEAAVAQH